jgi:hypothetical protein
MTFAACCSARTLSTRANPQPPRTLHHGAPALQKQAFPSFAANHRTAQRLPLEFDRLCRSTNVCSGWHEPREHNQERRCWLHLVDRSRPEWLSWFLFDSQDSFLTQKVLLTCVRLDSWTLWPRTGRYCSGGGGFAAFRSSKSGEEPKDV